jgi:molybdopterin-guanine dinucleotide biosynthesis protein A
MIVPVTEAATLLLLAGGESRRMGRPKALLPVGEATLIEWMASRLGLEFEHLLVSARDERQLPESLRTHLVRDLRPGAGPLAGIEAGLAATPHDVLVAVACDMPGVGVELTRRLVEASEGHDAAVPRLGGRPERRAAAALQELDVRWLDGEPAAQFANLNTPEDCAGFLDALRKKR